MSQQSAGVSLHAQGDVMINSDFGADSVREYGDNPEKFDKEAQCFYSLCLKITCCKCIPFGKFKDRKHAMYCYLFSAMVTCLMIAIIVPMVSHPFILSHTYNETPLNNKFLTVSIGFVQAC
jgi:hypothetical protein